MPGLENQDIEIKCLVEAIYQKYGYDFKEYSWDSFKRRVISIQKEQKIDTVSQILHQIIYDKAFFLLLLSKLTVNVTQMFRDPGFYRKLRENIFPRFESYPFIKIWLAGCSSGEEAYSIAIALKEEGLYKKSQIYATDISIPVLEKAKKGIYPAGMMKEYTNNYREGGGKKSLSDYYTAKYDHVIMAKALRENITFADHNLATDTCFGVMDIIFCRNVFIYFTRPLQSRVLRLFSESLGQGGILCLGSQESILFIEGAANCFKELYSKESIYIKQ
ncbi:MAG: protein-glutamate O-methyltransferase CheR [Pseudomonadota bacterium]